MRKHHSYATTTIPLSCQELDGAGCHQDECKQQVIKLLMDCSVLLTLAGLYQRFPEHLPDLRLILSYICPLACFGLGVYCTSTVARIQNRIELFSPESKRFMMNKNLRNTCPAIFVLNCS
jgi:hypothetical protein